MPKITLANPWTYCTPLMTIDYPAGVHDVDDSIAEVAPQVKAPSKPTQRKGKTDGDGTPTLDQASGSNEVEE